MWRAVFAIAHVDGKVSYKEKKRLNEVLTSQRFSPPQKETLIEDLSVAQDITNLFDLITDKEDVIDFFYIARSIAWCDGEFDAQERKILLSLQKRADIGNIQNALKATRDHFKVNKLHEIFESVGCGGLIDMVELKECLKLKNTSA
jgi:hypothetical protein